VFDLDGRFLIEILDDLYCICGKAQVVHYHEHFVMICGVERRCKVHNERVDVVAEEFLEAKLASSRAVITLCSC